MSDDTKIVQLCVNTIRMLTAVVVQETKSGHPARVTVEQATPIGRGRWTGQFIGMHSFGPSPPICGVAQHLGLTPDRVVQIAKQAMAAG